MKGLFIQEFKTLIKSPSSISILVLPLVLLIGLGYLLPSGWIVPSSITIGIVGAVLLYFGGSIEEIKRTSFMKSISLTRMNKFTFLATKILFSIFVSIIAVIWVLFFSWMSADVIGFLATDFSHIIPPDTSNGAALVLRQVPFVIHWDNIYWMQMIYAGILTITVSVALAFVFVAFSKSSLSFYLMSFGYLLAMILFGGVIMPSFLISEDVSGWFTTLYYFVPNFYTNNVMAQAFRGDTTNTVNSLTDSLSLIFNQAVPNASDEAIANVQIFLDAGDYSEEALNTAYASWISTNPSDADQAYYDYVYSFFTEAFQGDLLPNLISFILNHFSTQLAPLLNDAMGEHSREIATIIVNVIGEENLPFGVNITTISTAIKGFSSSGLFTEIFLQVFSNSEITYKIGLVIQSIIAEPLVNFLNPIVTNIEINSIFSQVGGVLHNMFNTANSWDYYVPWIETSIFLGMSTIFFKWS